MRRGRAVGLGCAAVLLASCTTTRVRLDGGPTSGAGSSDAISPAAPASSTRLVTATTTAARHSSPGPTAASCRRSQLATDYREGGGVSQPFYGLVVVWNVGAAACRLTGTATLTTALADGRTYRASAYHPIRVDVTLPAHTRAPVSGGSIERRYLSAGVIAPDTRSAEACYPRGALPGVVTPRSLTLTVGRMTFTVVNDDPHSSFHERHLQSCDGHFVLSGVRIIP